jgi:hypothetical protein
MQKDSETYDQRVLEMLACHLLFQAATAEEEIMRPGSQEESKTISLARTDLNAVKCEECGAKMYPQSLLKPHLTRHRRRQRWFNAEIRKLQYTFTHMRDIA